MSRKLININPNILKWARESAHMEIYEIPKSEISHKKLLEIEKGLASPTFLQLQKLARRYQRPLGVLLGDKIPENDYFFIPFFRRENKTDYDFRLALYIRELQEKQDWARNYLLSEGCDTLSFIGSIQLDDDILKVAEKIKNSLNLPSFQEFKKNEKYLKALKDALEKLNIFISITGSNKSNKSISLEQAQGFAIVDNIAPFIFVNTKNATNAKIFTLIHEVVHLFLNESGISENPIKDRKPECTEDKIEDFCNSVASEILMPRDIFLKSFEHASGGLEERIKQLSKYFLISELAICVRLWKLRMITYADYENVYSLIDNRIKKYLKEKAGKQKESKSGGEYYNNMRSKNGELLSKLAFSAYKNGHILTMDISNILSVKTGNLDRYFLAV